MEDIEFYFGSVLIKGTILVRQKHWIKVLLLSPYGGMEKECCITGPGRKSPHHFLTDEGDKRIKELLIENYEKLNYIYESFDRHCRLYIQLQNELKATNDIVDIEKSKLIKRKLESWFFDTLLYSSSTEFFASFTDMEYISGIFENHIKKHRYEYQPIKSKTWWFKMWRSFSKVLSNHFSLLF